MHILFIMLGLSGRFPQVVPFGAGCNLKLRAGLAKLQHDRRSFAVACNHGFEQAGRADNATTMTTPQASPQPLGSHGNAPG